MKMSPVVNDAYRLRKLLEKAAGLKVYKSDLLTNYFNTYLSIVQEYKNETNAHITVAQSSQLKTVGSIKFRFILLRSLLTIRK